MRINVGAGGRRISGWTGVDVVPRPAADIVAPADKIPLEDGSCDEIMAIHLVEHFLPWELPAVLKEWHRLMKPKGRLTLEMPDIVKCCLNLVKERTIPGKHADQLHYWGIYGDPREKDPYMLHRWGYTFKTLAPIVSAAGFFEIAEYPTQFHPVGKDIRDFRLEARKP
jgi:predicted SAM-dependent methyltransferase